MFIDMMLYIVLSPVSIAKEIVVAFSLRLYMKDRNDNYSVSLSLRKRWKGCRTCGLKDDRL